jgi:hypothetical protein
VGHGVVVAEILEERRQRREAVPDRGAGGISPSGQADQTPLEILAPFDDVGPGDNPKFLGSRNAGEAHEVANGVSVGSLGVWILDVAKPLDLERYVGEAEKFLVGQFAAGRTDFGWQLGTRLDELRGVGFGVGHVDILVLIKYVINTKPEREGREVIGP